MVFLFVVRLTMVLLGYGPPSPAQVGACRRLFSVNERKSLTVSVRTVLLKLAPCALLTAGGRAPSISSESMSNGSRC